MGVRIDGLGPDDVEAFFRAMSIPFSFDLPDDPDRRREMVERWRRLLQPERARCAFDGDDMVGTLAVFSLSMTVPGGSVSCAGTTGVTVKPSHRRRGILRSMMEAHLREAAEHDDPIAALWASDSAIYGRFGFGCASVEAHVEIPTVHSRFGRLAPEPAPVRLVPAAEAASLLREVYGRLLPERPGMYARSDAWWEGRRFRDEPDNRDGATAYRYAVADGPDGRPEGYVQYRVKPDWDDHHGNNQVRVTEAMFTAPEAAAGIWRFLLDHDLATSVRAHHRPPDDPVFDLLDAGRRAAPTLMDALWVRIVDPAAALTSRRYSAPARIVFQVRDPMGLSEGRWLLETDGESSACETTRSDPDIALDIGELGACYLGRSRFRELARAGRVAGAGEALARADLAFGWDPPPWCPEVF